MPVRWRAARTPARRALREGERCDEAREDRRLLRRREMPPPPTVRERVALPLTQPLPVRRAPRRSRAHRPMRSRQAARAPRDRKPRRHANAAPASSDEGRSAASSASGCVCACVVHAVRGHKRRAQSSAAPKRAAATSGPKSSQVAAAAGSERADGPDPQPQPTKSTMRRCLPSTRTATRPAKRNGADSKSALAAAASAERRQSGESVAATASVPAAKSAIRTSSHHAARSQWLAK